MLKELHGKHYYLVAGTSEVLKKALEYLKEEPDLADEEFTSFIQLIDSKFKSVLVSKAKCGDFIKTPKYAAWERVKRKTYTFRKKRELYYENRRRPYEQYELLIIIGERN